MPFAGHLIGLEERDINKQFSFMQILLSIRMALQL